jgi:hypothetical protein
MTKTVTQVIQEEIDAVIGPRDAHIPLAERITISLGAADLLWRAAEPTCNCFAPRVCPVHGQRYVWPESGEASFAHKPGCAILTAAGNPACSCGALKSTEPSAPHGPACECCVCIAAEIGAMKSRGES